MAAPVVASLFSGVGGFELGLERAGYETVFWCENWAPARAVLETRFPSVESSGDIIGLPALPAADVVTAGFPCTDLSQAGRTAGIDGAQSGLVRKALELVEHHPCTWLVLENVRNMLSLHRGRAMAAITEELERMNFRWAYRVVDSQFTGVPQRRQRVFLVASRTEDPRPVLFSDDAGPRTDDSYDDDAFGFYWTEGLRGLGWARDAVPTLKGGSTVGIPSPPAIWLRHEEPEGRFVVPGIRVAEQMQGFEAGWTEPASDVRNGERARWKLVGNAVTIGVSSWIGERLQRPGPWVTTSGQPIESGSRWPLAACGEPHASPRAVDVSMWPTTAPHQHLRTVLGDDRSPLSLRAATGFFSRLQRSRLHRPPEFDVDLKEYVALGA